ncbi:TetR/AcrR family transcriptional regulator [Salinimonas lutimaris]|uniref:TetR/AcrR family transcriptional regulator n=1 Tax=Salinimonas lutimaris TaxID=914153 RepID=UPI001586A53F|nr:TetR/AcrR family transcriptional regulator [Salinimonas lutimaris]
MIYEQTELLDKATELFWQKGFQATSMRDIQQALDMRPGSLYARFSGKADLFEKVIGHYAEQILGRLESAGAHESPLDACREFMVEELIRPAEKRYQRQCLLLNALAEHDKLDDGAKDALFQAMQKLHQGFAVVAGGLKNAGIIDAGVPEAQVGQWLQIQFVGLRNAAFLAQDDSQITLLIEKLMLDLQGQWPQQGAV